MDLLEKSNTGNRHPWEIARLEVAKSLINYQINDYKEKKILDLGCGDLFFIQKFSEDKPQTEFFAVDTAFNEEFIKNHKTNKIKIFRSLNDIPKQENLSFDIIFLMDVVEHIEDDLDFLKMLNKSSFVTEKTLVVITVPAYQTLFSQHDRFLGHYRRYTNSSIENVVKKAGFISLNKGYFFTSLLIPRTIEKLTEKIYDKKSFNGTGLTHWNKNQLITQTLKRLLLLDYKIGKLLKNLGINLPGLSNYIICKKPAS